jgi:hypothetical protein
MPYSATRPRRSRTSGSSFGRSSGFSGGRSTYSRGGNAGGARRGPKKDYIHPSRFVKAARLVELEPY